METRNCQNCKNDFTIEPDDFSFYEKISVPPPTFCPECRMIRRLCWRNHRTFYKRSCELCSKSLLSVYKEGSAPVMCSECWNGDGWDQHRDAKDIVWDEPLFNQINDLFQIHPRAFQYRVGTNVNCDYANSVVNCKNIYLTFSVLYSEDISYSENIDNSKNSIDCLCVSNLDKCSWNVDSSENYNCHFMIESNKNIDSHFLYDCSNCQNCCLSSNLRNKSYVFRNEQLSKEKYNEVLRSLSLGSFSGYSKVKSEFNILKERSITKYAKNLNSVNATGEHINNSKDVNHSFDVGKSENVSYGYRIIYCKDMKDCNWVLNGELEYETISGTENSNTQVGCAVCFSSARMEYSLFCRSSSNCFGCVGLKNANYCILNKQYTKEEYLEIVPKLRQQMNDIPFIDSRNRIYRYGEFFPYELSPFGYNETLAHDFFQKRQEEAEALGFNWKNIEPKSYQTTKNNNDLPDNIIDIYDDILTDVIECPNKGDYMFQCTSAFKITKEELLFYRQNNLPIPRLCPNCRHYERLTYRNPMRLYKRSCMCDKKGHFHGDQHCEVEFETSYAPERPEKVYCEKCYQAEVL